MRVYSNHPIDYLLGRKAADADQRDWQNLNDVDSDMAAAAVLRLVRRTMYLEELRSLSYPRARLEYEPTYSGRSSRSGCN